MFIDNKYVFNFPRIPGSVLLSKHGLSVKHNDKKGRTYSENIKWGLGFRFIFKYLFAKIWLVVGLRPVTAQIFGFSHHQVSTYYKKTKNAKKWKLAYCKIGPNVVNFKWSSKTDVMLIFFHPFPSLALQWLFYFTSTY